MSELTDGNTQFCHSFGREMPGSFILWPKLSLSCLLVRAIIRMSTS